MKCFLHNYKRSVGYEVPELEVPLEIWDNENKKIHYYKVSPDVYCSAKEGNMISFEICNSVF